jgi:uncharacterized protein (TIGR03437 family)
MRAPVLLLLLPCAISANQPTFSYSIPAGATVAAIAVDATGNTYLTGSTTSSSLPATAGALQNRFNGGTCEVLPAFHGGQLMLPCTDAFVIKLDPAGNVLLATWFGGNGNQTTASAICVDATGSIYLAGTTFPNTVSQPNTFPLTAGAAFTNFANSFGFVAKLNPSGTALVYSTLLPVNPPALAMPQAVALAIDKAGEAYIATTTAGALPFPTTPGAFQLSPPPANQNGSGVLAKLNTSGSALLYATYLSGNGLSVPQGIAVDAAGDAFVVGFTQATDFPVTPGAFQTGYFASANYMEFVTRLNPQGTSLLYSTFLGATRNYASVVKVDAHGGAYVLAQGGAELSSGGYLSHLSADGSALVFSTYLPTTNKFALDLDSAGSAFVAGAAGDALIATSPGAFQSDFQGSLANAYAAKFTADGESAGATYAGPLQTGATPLIAVAPNGSIVLAEQTSVFSIYPWLTVQNAASGEAGAVAPGETVTLRGYGIGPATAAVASGRAPANPLGGTQVSFGGIAAPIVSAQAQQVTVQAPWELSGQTSAEVAVTYNGGPPAGSSASAPVVVGKSAPGIFGVANSDGTLNSPSNPAQAGGFMTIYGTGGGLTSPLGITGGLWPITASLSTLSLPVSVSIGGTNAVVLYAGPAPTLESGYFQINVSLPYGTQTSSAPNLVVTVGDSSSAAVPISVQ